MESDVNYPRQADPAFMAPFDLTMTYRRDSDVWIPYVPDAGSLLAPPSPKTEAAPAVYMASNANDRSGRHAYVGEMMRHMAIDSYGRCHHNRTLEQIRDFLEVDSVGYVSLEGMLACAALPATHYCTACWSGKYPVPIAYAVNKFMMEKYQMQMFEDSHTTHE